MNLGIAVVNLAALVMIYAGYVQRWSLLAVGGVLVLAVTMYLHGRSVVRHEVLPHLDRKVSEIERWIRDDSIDVPELESRVKSLRSSLRVWGRVG